jgi:hypothetical protein
MRTIELRILSAEHRVESGLIRRRHACGNRDYRAIPRGAGVPCSASALIHGAGNLCYGNPHCGRQWRRGMYTENRVYCNAGGGKPQRIDTRSSPDVRIMTGTMLQVPSTRYRLLIVNAQGNTFLRQSGARYGPYAASRQF